MVQQIEKTNGCVLFRTVVEAAEELDQAEALELLLTYAHIGLGDEVDLDKCSKVVRLILKQTVPALAAAERRRQASINNGNKGKEHGKKGGRPRNGETKEEAYERRNTETPTKPLKTPNITTLDTLQKPLETPNKPLEKEKEVEYEKEIEKEVDNELNKETTVKEKPEYSFEEFSLQLKNLCLTFIRKHQDYNYLLDEEMFQEFYYDNVVRFQIFVNEQLNSNIPIKDCVLLILGYANEQELSI